MNLTGKKILFIGIGFYDYEDAICRRLREKGASVSYLNSCGAMRWVNQMRRCRLTAPLGIRIKNLCRRRRINRLPSDFDIIFTVKGEELTAKDIGLLREKNPRARRVLYLWDSLALHQNTELLLANFDAVYSFDREDCRRCPSLIFRPLFFREKTQGASAKTYELSFIGLNHSDRFALLRNVKTQLEAAGMNHFIRLFFGRFDYVFFRNIKKAFSPTDKTFVTDRRTPYAAYKEVLERSQVVLDISHPLQSGLTMRTIEALAMGCKVLTTNTDIIHYPQIPPQSYAILDRARPVIPQPLLPEAALPDLPDYFSLDHFLSEILDPAVSRQSASA